MRIGRRARVIPRRILCDCRNADHFTQVKLGKLFITVIVRPPSSRRISFRPAGSR